MFRRVDNRLGFSHAKDHKGEAGIAHHSYKDFYLHDRLAVYNRFNLGINNKADAL